MESSRNADAGIVEAVLSAIQQDAARFPHLARAEETFRELHSVLGKHGATTGGANGGLAAVLAGDNDLHTEAVVANAEVALKFVEEELGRWKKIKACRPLTDEEKRSIEEYLDPLLEALDRLLG